MSSVAARPISQAEVDAITKRFEKARVERMLGGELTHHLGYPPGGERPADTTNQRNGTSGKTVLTDDGRLTLAIPRDRNGHSRATVHRLSTTRFWPCTPAG